MRALSLHQPWATLIALGIKETETRSRSTNHRGPLAIHAAKVWTLRQRDAAADWAERYPQHADVLLNPPRGGVVAVANVVEVFQFGLGLPAYVTEADYRAGDMADGRWGYRLDTVLPVDPIFLVNGRQSLWTLSAEETDAVMGRIA